MRAAIAAFPLVFLAHDLEEALGAQRMNELLGRPLAGRLEELVPGGAPAWFVGLSEVSRDEMLVAAALLFVAGAAAAWPLALRPRRGAFAAAVATAASLRLANSVMHGFHAAVARRYVPGLATSLAAGLPVSVAVLRALRRDGLITAPGLAAGVLAGPVLLPPAALLTRLVAREIAGRAH
jgi:hypothetical protein